MARLALSRGIVGEELFGADTFGVGGVRDQELGDVAVLAGGLGRGDGVDIAAGAGGQAVGLETEYALGAVLAVVCGLCLRLQETYVEQVFLG